MSRALIILFTSLYVLVSSGMVVTLHYCKGELEEVLIGDAEMECCAMMKQQTSCCHLSTPAPVEDCCDDEIVMFQLSDVQQPAPQFRILVPMLETATTKLVEERLLTQSSENSHSPYWLEPPPPEPQPMWLLHHSLTLYG